MREEWTSSAGTAGLLDACPTSGHGLSLVAQGPAAWRVALHGATSERSRKLQTARRSCSSTSHRVEQIIDVDEATRAEKVLLVQIVKQNAVPGILEGFNMNLGDWKGRAGFCGTHVHWGTLLYTESAKIVRIDLVSNIVNFQADARMKMHEGLEANLNWKQVGPQAWVTRDVTVDDLWKSARPQEQYIFCGPMSNNCQDVANRVFAHATGTPFERNYDPEKWFVASMRTFSSFSRFQAPNIGI